MDMSLVVVVVMVAVVELKLNGVVDEVDAADDDDVFDEIGVRKVVLILSSPPPPLLPKIIISGVRVETKNTTKKRHISKK